MIIINYSSDIIKATYDALGASDINTYLKPHYQVSLKPNLVVAGPASNGAVTHPEVAEGVIRWLVDFGVRSIEIIESSSLGVNTTDAYKYSGFEDMAKKYAVALIDLKKNNTAIYRHGGYDIEAYIKAVETDFLINIPVLKAHCQTRLTCCLKNLKGCIPDNEKRRFHTLGIHKPVAALNGIIKTGYCVVDGICGDLTFEEGGTPVIANRIITCRDPLMTDSFCAGLIGYKPDDIEYLSHGKKIGLGRFFTKDTCVTELNADNKPKYINTNVQLPLTADKYRGLIDERNACSVCYASLIHALCRSGSVYHTGDRSGVYKLHIGQGYRGKTGTGIGIGNCTCGFDNHIKGCPPTAADIIESLE